MRIGRDGHGEGNAYHMLILKICFEFECSDLNSKNKIENLFEGITRNIENTTIRGKQNF